MTKLGGQLIMFVGGLALLAALYALLMWIGVRWYLLLLAVFGIAAALIFYGIKGNPSEAKVIPLSKVKTKDLDMTHHQYWTETVKLINIMSQDEKFMYFPFTFHNEILNSHNEVVKDYRWPGLKPFNPEISIYRVERALKYYGIDTTRSLYDFQELEAVVSKWLVKAGVEVQDLKTPPNYYWAVYQLSQEQDV